MRMDRSPEPRLQRKTSPTLHDCLLKFSSAPPGPILDLACGAGRHTRLLASLSRNVVAVDADIHRLVTLKQTLVDEAQKGPKRPSASSSLVVQVDLKQHHWPLAKQVFSKVEIVHYLQRDILSMLDAILAPGGYIYLETYGGHGGNHLSLPRAGAMRLALARRYELDFYRERRVGPPDQAAVTVCFLARKLTNLPGVEGRPRPTRGAALPRRS